MFWEENKETKPKAPKYNHKHEIIITENHEYQAQKYLAEIPQIFWVIEKTFGGKNKYILQSDSKEHIDYFLLLLKKYVDSKEKLASIKLLSADNVNKDEGIKLSILNKDGDEKCVGSLEHIRFKHIDGSWYGG